jgi:hypothetical protein
VTAFAAQHLFCLNSDNCLCKDKSIGREGCYINKTMRYKFAPVRFEGLEFPLVLLLNLLSADGELNPRSNAISLCERSENNNCRLISVSILL